MKNKLLLIGIIFFSLVLQTIPAFADSFTFSGHLKSYALTQDKISIKNTEDKQTETIDSNIQSQNSLRLMSSFLSNNIGNIEIHYEVQPIYFSNTDFATGDGGLGSTISVGNNQYRYKDLNPILNEVVDNTVILQNLDRFNYQYSNEFGDLTLGRQVISFGSSRFINPTDIFIPFSIQTLNQEYRVGIDAIRYKADVGTFAVIDAGIIIGEDGKKQNSAAFLRGKNSIKGNDVEVMLIALDDAWLIGGGLERAIGDFGFWFETAYMDWHQTDIKVNESTTFTTNVNVIAPYTKNYWRTSIGSDYAISENIIVMFEYHYNGAGSSDSLQYNMLATQAPYQKAGVYLYGEHYLIPAVSWLVSPLLSINTSAFYNVSDHSIFVNISGETSWSDNLYSDFGVYLSHGEGIQYQGSSDHREYILGSEFGSYPISFFASLRYYF